MPLCDPREPKVNPKASKTTPKMRQKGTWEGRKKCMFLHLDQKVPTSWNIIIYYVLRRFALRWNRRFPYMFDSKTIKNRWISRSLTNLQNRTVFLIFLGCKVRFCSQNWLQMSTPPLYRSSPFSPGSTTLSMSCSIWHRLSDPATKKSSKLCPRYQKLHMFGPPVINNATQRKEQHSECVIFYW